MEPFLFIFDGVPLPENHNYGTINGAKIRVLVMARYAPLAEESAIDLVNKYLWSVKEVEDAFILSPEQISYLDTLNKLDASLYQKALSDGISIAFLAYPKTNRKDEAPILIENP